MRNNDKLLIKLPKELKKKLKELAYKLDISMAEYLRRLIK